MEIAVNYLLLQLFTSVGENVAADRGTAEES